MNSWTTKEIETLISNYAVMTPAALSALIPGRTKQAIAKKAQRLMLRVPTMTAHLITYIRGNNHSASTIASNYGCSVRTVYRAKRILHGNSH